ncbi:hypothetical protein OH76DRAFT_492775 [Lentinus brumalis]|uniref:Uncharacterized protein n=1 Tax=Lentinus brumalis TaxID=2498619 RepID=A0A371DBH2_9APHY|nr:hypothetical protein OH76DRAFT_492775 [Polyporus brumalis]
MSGGCRRLVGATLASSDLGRWLAPDCSRPCRGLIRPGPAIKPSSRGLQAPLAASQPSCARKRGINERRTEQTAQHAEHPAHTHTHTHTHTAPTTPRTHTHDTDNTTRRAYMQAIRIPGPTHLQAELISICNEQEGGEGRRASRPASRPNSKLASTSVLSARARSSSSVFARRPQAAQLIRNQNAVNALKQRMPEPPRGNPTAQGRPPLQSRTYQYCYWRASRGLLSACLGTSVVAVGRKEAVGAGVAPCSVFMSGSWDRDRPW